MKDETILLRVPAEEKKKLSQKAEAAGLSLSAYVRRCCEGEAPKPMPPPEFWEELQKLYLLHGSCRVGGHEEFCAQIEKLILLLQEAM